MSVQYRPNPEYKNKVRYYFYKLPVDLRIKDSKTLETLVKTPKEWKRDPLLMDFKCIDTPNPYKKTIRIFNPKSGHTEIRIWIDKIHNVEEPDGYIEYSRKSKNKIHIENVWISKNARGKCVGDYLLRNVINNADKNCWKISLEARPFDYGRFSKKVYESNLKKLINFYAQFGFIPKGNAYDGPKTPRQPMIRPNICKN